jgi:hypothetical protein
MMGGRNAQGLLDDTWELSINERSAMVLDFDLVSAAFPPGSTYLTLTSRVRGEAQSVGDSQFSVTHDVKLYQWNVDGWQLGPETVDAGAGYAPLTMTSRDRGLLTQLLSQSKTLSLKLTPRNGSGSGVAFARADSAVIVVEYEVP